MPKVQYSLTERLAIVEEITCGVMGIMAATYKYGVTKTTLAKWRRRFGVFGYERAG